MTDSRIRLATCAFPQFQPDMGVPVRITVGHPRYKLAYDLRHKIGDIAPDAYTLRWDDRPRFELHYRRKLAALGVDAIERLARGIHLTERAAPEARLVLLCFEDLSKPGWWCHRTMFAQWWSQETGEPVPELGRLPRDLEFRPGAPAATTETDDTLF